MLNRHVTPRICVAFPTPRRTRKPTAVPRFSPAMRNMKSLANRDGTLSNHDKYAVSDVVILPDIFSTQQKYSDFAEFYTDGSPTTCWCESCVVYSSVFTDA